MSEYWIVYMIECADGKLYTGITQNLKRRLSEHQRKGSHFTSYNPLKKLVYSEKHVTKFAAEMREAQIKRWSRAKKLALVNHNKILLRELSKSRD